jgi:signal recognition particle GTPase
MPRKECGSLDDEAGPLDHSSLCIQGLRGCGKTYTVARMMTALLQAGKRVGICLTARMAPAIAMPAGRGCWKA